MTHWLFLRKSHLNSPRSLKAYSKKTHGFYRSFEKNYDASGRFLSGYSTPLTDATFSYAFAGIDSERVGMIVVCDED